MGNEAITASGSKKLSYWPTRPAELARGPKEDSTLKGTLIEIAEAAEKVAIAQALTTNDFHRERTAKSLGISVRTLHYKMNRYNLH
jgi:two-component system NtrC family response regulator